MRVTAERLVKSAVSVRAPAGARIGSCQTGAYGSFCAAYPSFLAADLGPEVGGPAHLIQRPLPHIWTAASRKRKRLLRVDYGPSFIRNADVRSRPLSANASVSDRPGAVIRAKRISRPKPDVRPLRFIESATGQGQHPTREFRNDLGRRRTVTVPQTADEVIGG